MSHPDIQKNDLNTLILCCIYQSDDYCRSYPK